MLARGPVYANGNREVVERHSDPGDRAPSPGHSYHGKSECWRRDKGDVLLQTVGRGQEFVLDCDHCPKVEGWLREVFKFAPTVRRRGGSSAG